MNIEPFYLTSAILYTYQNLLGGFLANPGFQVQFCFENEPTDSAWDEGAFHMRHLSDENQMFLILSPSKKYFSTFRDQL